MAGTLSFSTSFPLRPKITPKGDRHKDKGLQGKTGRAEAKIKQGHFSYSYYHQVAASKPEVAFLTMRKDMRLNVKLIF